MILVPRRDLVIQFLQSLREGLAIWYPGVFPPALIAFKVHVQPIDPSFHVDSLGYRTPEVSEELLESAAVIHFSGPAKPWLEIGFPEVRGLWIKHVNSSNKFVRKCRVLGWRNTKIPHSHMILILEENHEHGFGPEGRRFCLQSLLTLSSRPAMFFLPIIANRRKVPRIILHS